MVNITNIQKLITSLTPENAEVMGLGFNMCRWINTETDERLDKLDSCKTTACMGGWCYILANTNIFPDMKTIRVATYGSYIEFFDPRSYIPKHQISEDDLVKQATDWLGLSQQLAMTLFGMESCGIQHITPDAAIAALRKVRDMEYQSYTEIELRAWINGLYEGTIHAKTNRLAREQASA